MLFGGLSQQITQLHGAYIQIPRHLRPHAAAGPGRVLERELGHLRGGAGHLAGQEGAGQDGSSGAGGRDNVHGIGRGEGLQKRLVGFALLEEAAGISGAVAMLAGHGAELLGAGLGAGPGHEADATAIGGLYHAVARIAVRQCELGLRGVGGRVHFAAALNPFAGLTG
jgi:hypothetical protein